MTSTSKADKSDPLITLRDLSKSFGGHRALRNIDLTLNKGEVREKHIN